MRLLSVVLVSVSAIAAIACGAGAPSGKPAAASAKPASNSTRAKPKPTRSAPRLQSPSEIAAHSTPAIVSVRTRDSLGTGFIVRQDGWVATNFHVLAGSPEILVTLADKREFPVVSIINRDRFHDLVILRIDAKNLPVLHLAPGDSVHPGDPVVAIGHPLGLEDTVTNGLVSAVRRDDDFEVLQISAPIAPGSSGGPLFNDRGEVIGVATAILRGGQNLNFGLPVKYVKKMLADPDPMSLLVFAAELASLEPSLPQIQRNIPRHSSSLLDGCKDESMALIVKTLGDAIEVGAPLYNRGDFAACYHIYEGAAADLERKLPGACKGPKRALSEGRKRAAKLGDPSASAWAMRDAFDGLFGVIERRTNGR